jgi:hypothetical protein
VINGINHHTASHERHPWIQTTDMFAMNDIGNAIAIQQTLNHGQLPNVLRIHEMDHPHRDSLDGILTAKTCPSIALSSSPFYTEPAFRVFP